MPAVLYDKFEMPECIKIDESSESRNFCKFIAEPFERGVGHTMGNAMRRMLLTAIEAPAIVSFHFEGVPHEYMAIEGVVEDVTNIILNLKGALLRRIPTDENPNVREPTVLTTMLDIKQSDLGETGQVVVKLGDIIPSAQYEVVNPELPIFSVTKPLTKRIDIKVAIGRGYVPSEFQNIETSVVDEIVMDSTFSPVTMVNYFVEDTRVGQQTDLDRLVLEVTTDGRVSPREAVAFASKILIQHLNAFNEMDEREISFEEPVTTDDTDLDDLMHKLALGINEIELSVRSTNCLNGANIATIGELVVMPEPKLLQFRNFGKKSLNEIKAKLNEMNLSLGMDLTRFGITEENIKDKIAEHHENVRGSTL